MVKVNPHGSVGLAGSPEPDLAARIIAGSGGRWIAMRRARSARSQANSGDPRIKTVTAVLRELIAADAAFSTD
jgi:hypothetical protein